MLLFSYSILIICHSLEEGNLLNFRNVTGEWNVVSTFAYIAMGWIMAVGERTFFKLFPLG